MMAFDSSFYMYLGSAFGSGGLQARLKHHLQPVRSAHWHIDYLRSAAEVVDVWYTHDDNHLECAWAQAAASLQGASTVANFGSSDCTCSSHLVALRKLPHIPTFRRWLNAIHPGSARIFKETPMSP
jgi:Uri superfamily endonuclease